MSKATAELFYNRFVVPYRDLDDNHPDPTTGEPLSHTWLGMVASGQEEMWNTFSVVNARDDSSVQGLEVYTPTFTGLTVGATWKVTTTYDAVYLQVGQICTVFLTVDITAWETEVGFSVPIPAARNVISSTVGFGYVEQSSTRKTIVGRLEGQNIMLYHTDGTGNDGKVGSTSPFDPTTTDVEMVLQARYRTIEPPAGRLEHTRVRRSFDP